MAASSISNTQFSPVSSISSTETSAPVNTGEPAPNEPARPQLGAAAQESGNPDAVGKHPSRREAQRPQGRSQRGGEIAGQQLRQRLPADHPAQLRIERTQPDRRPE